MPPLLPLSPRSAWGRGFCFRLYPFDIGPQFGDLLESAGAPSQRAPAIRGDPRHETGFAGHHGPDRRQPWRRRRRPRPKSPIQLSVGGFFRTAYMVVLDDDDSLPDNVAQEPGDDKAEDGVFSDAEIHFVGRTVLDNGLEVGARVELEGEDDNSPRR